MANAPLWNGCGKRCRFSKIKLLVDEISVASRKQARSLKQSGNAVVQMERLTQSSAASAEESASASEQLSSHSDTMKQLAAQLTAMVESNR